MSAVCLEYLLIKLLHLDEPPDNVLILIIEWIPKLTGKQNSSHSQPWLQEKRREEKEEEEKRSRHLKSYEGHGCCSFFHFKYYTHTLHITKLTKHAVTYSHFAWNAHYNMATRA